MPEIEFNDYPYYPALLSNDAEHRGYAELKQPDKENVCPILELSHRRAAVDLSEAIDLIKASSGDLPFILDLNPHSAPPPYVSQDPEDPVADAARYKKELAAQKSFNSVYNALNIPKQGFSNWRSLVSQFPNAVPTLRYNNPALEEKEILNQAATLSKSSASFAIRIYRTTDFSVFPLVAKILNSLSEPQLLVIFDCGQRRIEIKERAEFVTNGIGAIKADLKPAKHALLRAVCLSNSFMKPTKRGLIDYKNKDIELLEAVSSAFPFLAGDYGSTYRIHPSSTYFPSDWVATVVFPELDTWHHYRDNQSRNKQGWVDGADKISNEPYFKKAPKTWGVDAIKQAAKGNLSGISSTSAWYAAKVNIHLHRKINSV